MTSESKSFDAKSRDEKIEYEDNYFERASVLYYLVIMLGFASFEVLCFQTQLYPFEMLGGPGKRLHYLAENFMPFLHLGFFGSIFLHVIEAVYTYSKCRSLNMSQSATNKWTFQTFLLGYLSLRLLIAYSDKKAKKK